MNNFFLFDIDGTLSFDGIITPKTIETLDLIRKNGNYVMLATGRCLGQMEDVLNKINIDGAIINNGAYAYLKDEIIFESPISKEIIKEMINDNLHVAALTNMEYVRFSDDDIYKSFTANFSIKEPKRVNLDYIDNNVFYSLGLYSDNLASLDISKYPLQFIKVSDLGYDIINIGVSKASPLAKLRKIYSNSKFIAFGDNYNDIELLRYADVSIVMGQAPQEVKEYADFVTKEPLNEGISYAVNNFLGDFL